MAESHSFEKQLNSLARKWREFFSNPPYPYVSVAFNSFEIHLNWKMRSRAGVCRPHDGVIELNPNLLQDEKILEEVFIHELCHLVVSRRWPRAQAHGERWKKLMSHCGMKPKRCHDLVAEKRHLHRRWELQCACQVHKVTTLILNRIKKGQRYKCKSCGHVLRDASP